MTLKTMRTRTRQRSGLLAACGLLSLALAGCNAHDRGVTNAIPLTSVEDRHPILQPGEMSVFDMPIDRLEGRMSTRERTNLEVYLQGYRENGAGPLFIAMPQGTPNENAAVRRVGEVRKVAYQVGVPEDSIVFEPYTPYAGAHGFPVTLRYQVYKMVVPECGAITQDLAFNPGNRPYDNFGCAGQHNLAVMVADPNDLRRPHKEEPRYAPERNRVLEKYGKGELTASQNNQQAGGEIADAGK
ncbi:MAG: CpaD family pilus assembly protein [Rhodobiaceae bacterium]|nr:CpaD family pilus assembly protein [Rhodobiaceae bacterium]